MKYFSMWIKVNDEWIANEIITQEDTVTMYQISWIDWAKESGYLAWLTKRGKRGEWEERENEKSGNE